jgi:hypothetical protein
MRRDLDTMLKAEGRALPDGVGITDVEQIVVDAQLHVTASGERGQRSLTCGSQHLVVRMVRDVDWLKLLTALFGEVKSEMQDGYAIHLVKAPQLGPAEVSLCAIDPRTLVMVQKKDDRYLISKKGATSSFNAGPGWEQVKRLPFVVALDNRDGHWTKTLAPEVKEIEGSGALLKSIDGLCLGVTFGAGIDARAILTSKDPASAKECVAAVAALGKFLRARVDEERKADAQQPDADIERRLGAEMLKSGSVQLQGTTVTVEGRSALKLIDLLPTSGAPK